MACDISKNRYNAYRKVNKWQNIMGKRFCFLDLFVSLKAVLLIIMFIFLLLWPDYILDRTGQHRYSVQRHLIAV